MVDGLLIVFVIVSAMEVIASLAVVTAKKLMWAAFWLAIALVTMAGIFFLFESEYVALIQIIVYAGAVPVLFLFGIMLTRSRVMEEVP